MAVALAREGRSRAGHALRGLAGKAALRLALGRELGLLWPPLRGGLALGREALRGRLRLGERRPLPREGRSAERALRGGLSGRLPREALALAGEHRSALEALRLGALGGLRELAGPLIHEAPPAEASAGGGSSP